MMIKRCFGPGGAWRASAWVLALFVLGLVLRLALLGSLPGGLNQDEASIGYDAWALLHYGIDRNGFSWPVNLVAWGSGQNALYAWLSMPFIALGGLSVLSIRLLAAVLGALVLWLFWRLGRRAEVDMGWCALLLVATSPWHIMASRWALESNILPAVVLLAVWLFMRAARAERSGLWLALAAGVLTLSVYAYGPAYMFAPLFLSCALVLMWRERLFGWRGGVASLAVAAVVALPMMAFLLNNWVGSGSVQIGPFSLPRYSGAARYGTIFLPFAENGWQRTYDNVVTVIGLMFGGRDDGMPANAIPGWGPQYVMLTPFVLWGVQYAMRRQGELLDRLMLAWLVCALLTACMTDANINRINLVWLPSLWLAARGLWLLGDVPVMRRGAVAVLLVLCLSFSQQMFTRWRQPMADAFFEGLGDSISAAIAAVPPDTPIYITNHANMPYITALFVARTPPQRYVATAVISDRSAAFQSVQAFDRFHFGLDMANLVTQSAWVVHRSEVQAFDAPGLAMQSHGDYVTVLRRPVVAEGCEHPIVASELKGQQDFGTLGDDAEVGMRGVGFTITGQRWARGLGVHGTSSWTYQSDVPLQSLRFGMGISDGSSCSDGMRFRVRADGRTVFEGALLPPGKLRFEQVNLGGARSVSLETDAGPTNSCDHGNWIRPVLNRCAP